MSLISFDYDLESLKIIPPLSAIIYGSYQIIRLYLNKTNNLFRLLPEHRKMYVIKNLIKSVMLAGLCGACIPTIIIPAIFYKAWSNYWCHRLGIIYTINDTMGLMLVKNLPSSTKYHHQITTLLCAISLGVDFQTSQLGQMLFVYTIASSGAYLVNYYLGSRFLYRRGTQINIKLYARNIYMAACCINWGWHLFWLMNNYSIIQIQHIIYFLSLILIVKDDLILMNWLSK